MITTICSTACRDWQQQKHTQAPYYCPFVMKIHRWPVNSRYKGPVIRKAFLCHHVSLRYTILTFHRYILYHRKHEKDIYSFSIIVQHWDGTGSLNHSLRYENHTAFEYLGVYMDEIFHWSEYVNYLCSSFVKYFGIFNHIKSHQNYQGVVNMPLHIQKLNIELKFMAADQMSILTKVRIIQNKLMKLLLRLDPKTSTNELHRDINILQVSDIYKEISLIVLTKY